MNRYYYFNSIDKFKTSSSEEILGILVQNNDFSLEFPQRDAWRKEISILKDVLVKFDGSISFEYSIPRMGKRIDVILLIGPIIFILEFKIGEDHFSTYAIDQVWDYALDLKNFHESSHTHLIVPILIATESNAPDITIATTPQNDQILILF